MWAPTINPVTSLNYTLPYGMDVSMVIYDINGREVTTLVSGFKEVGYHSVEWYANSSASGIYFVKVESGLNVSTQKLMLMK